MERATQCSPASAAADALRAWAIGESGQRGGWSAEEHKDGPRSEGAAGAYLTRGIKEFVPRVITIAATTLPQPGVSPLSLFQSGDARIADLDTS
jgi:hypothetical protein